MRLYIRSLVYFKEILNGITLNYCKSLKVFRYSIDELRALKDSGHSLLIGSIFKRLKFTDPEGNVGLFPDDKKGHWRDASFNAIRDLLSSDIDFEIIGNKEELDFIKKYNPPLYDKIILHVIWKAKKKNETI